MEKRAEKLIENLEERVKFFSQMGIDFIELSAAFEEPSSPSIQSLIDFPYAIARLPLLHTTLFTLYPDES